MKAKINFQPLINELKHLQENLKPLLTDEIKNIWQQTKSAPRDKQIQTLTRLTEQLIEQIEKTLKQSSKQMVSEIKNTLKKQVSSGASSIKKGKARTTANRKTKPSKRAKVSRTK